MVRPSKRIPNGTGGFEIPFLICMGISFLFTMIVMIAISLAGPKINPKAFDIDTSMFKISPSTTVLIVVKVILLTALYANFW